jgi:hypothetical protein
MTRDETLNNCVRQLRALGEEDMALAIEALKERTSVSEPALTERDLQDIEAQADETSPYYLPQLIAEIRRLRARSPQPEQEQEVGFTLKELETIKVALERGLLPDESHAIEYVKREIAGAASRPASVSPKDETREPYLKRFEESEELFQRIKAASGSPQPEEQK